TQRMSSTRREVLAASAAALLAKKVSAQGSVDAANSEPFWKKVFPAGFRNERVKTSGGEINTLVGGSGPPLLLMHGAPQSLITWRLIAEDLAKEFSLVLIDLRGYGDSSKPEDGENHANYSKRAIALDGVEVMKHYGHERFLVVGHDRGGRVGTRMA